RHTRSKRDWSSDVCSSDLLDNVENGETILQILSNNTQIRAVVSEVNLEKIESGDTVNIIKDDENEVTGEVNNVSELPVATNQEKIGRASCRERERNKRGKG